MLCDCKLYDKKRVGTVGVSTLLIIRLFWCTLFEVYGAGDDAQIVAADEVDDVPAYWAVVNVGFNALQGVEH